MKVVLISTYDLGAGHEVTCLDLSVERLREQPVCDADWIAFHLPMHTATRLAAPVFARVRRLNPAAHLCCYGLYAPLNEAYLRGLGVHTIMGGKFEAVAASLANSRPSPMAPLSESSTCSVTGASSKASTFFRSFTGKGGRLTVFVTRGTGYMGRRVIERLIARGHAVRALERPGSERKLPAGATAVAGNGSTTPGCPEYVPCACPTDSAPG